MHRANPGICDEVGRSAEQWHLSLGREPIAHAIRMLQSPKFALAEAEECLDRQEVWMALRLCELGLRYYDVYLPPAVTRYLRDNHQPDRSLTRTHFCDRVRFVVAICRRH